MLHRQTIAVWECSSFRWDMEHKVHTLQSCQAQSHASKKCRTECKYTVIRRCRITWFTAFYCTVCRLAGLEFIDRWAFGSCYTKHLVRLLQKKLETIVLKEAQHYRKVMLSAPLNCCLLLYYCGKSRSCQKRKSKSDTRTSPQSQQSCRKKKILASKNNLPQSQSIYLHIVIVMEWGSQQNFKFSIWLCKDKKSTKRLMYRQRMNQVWNTKLFSPESQLKVDTLTQEFHWAVNLRQILKEIPIFISCCNSLAKWKFAYMCSVCKLTSRT